MVNSSDQKNSNLHTQSDIDNLPTQSTLSINKIKWVTIALGSIIAICLILGIIFLCFYSRFSTQDVQNKAKETQQKTKPSDNITLLEQREQNEIDEQKVDKEISNSDTTWLGIEKIPNRQEQDTSIPWYIKEITNYELWRIDESTKEKLLIDTFKMMPWYKIEWNLNKKDGIDVLYVTSPGAAFEVTTHIIYDEDGVERFRISHQSNSSNFTFKQNPKPEYEVSLIFEGICDGLVPPYPATATLPEVLLKGIIIKLPEEKKEFVLNKSEKIPCEVDYGDIIINPIIESPIFDEEKIQFLLPNNQTSTIYLTPEKYLEIEFN